ncbi:MAG: STAS/SEC14 domain-containing protein [Sandaracinaceae bacterium]
MATVTLRLSGHLTREALEAELVDVVPALEESACEVLVDCHTMTGYDSEARAAFVEFLRAHRSNMRRIAVVTDKTLWHMVVSTMALASGVAMRAFSDAESAQHWLRSA